MFVYFVLILYFLTDNSEGNSSLPRIDGNKLLFLPAQETDFVPKLESGSADFGILDPYYSLVSKVKDLVFPFGIPWGSMTETISEYVKQIETTVGATNLTIADLTDPTKLANITEKFDPSTITPDKAIDFGKENWAVLPIFIIIVIVMVIFTIIFPWCALSFCCCRLCGQCGGKMVQKSPSKVFFAIYLATTIVNTLAIGGLMGTYGAASHNFNNDHPGKLYDFVNNLQDDLKEYAIGTLNDTQVTLINTIDFAQVVFFDVLDSAPNRVFQRFLDQISSNLIANATSYDPFISDFSNAYEDLGNQTSEMYYNNPTNSTINMKTISDLLQDAVNDLAASANCGSSCDTNVKDQLNKHILSAMPSTTLDPIPTMQVTDIMTSVFADVSDLINSTISSSLDTIKDLISGQIDENKAPLISDIGKLQTVISDFKYSNYTDQYANISEIMDIMDKTTWARTAVAAPYMIPCGITSFLAISGIIIGLLGKCTDLSDLPHERSVASNIGGLCVTGSGLLSFIAAYFYLVSTFPLFVALTPGGLVCNDIKDGTLFKETIDKDYITSQKSLLGQLVLDDGNQNFTFSGILDDCRNGSGLLGALHFRELLNISKFFDIDSILDPTLITSPISSVNFSNFQIFTPSLEDQMNSLIGQLDNVSTVVADLQTVMNNTVKAYINQLQNDVPAVTTDPELAVASYSTCFGDVSGCLSLSNIRANLVAEDLGAGNFPVAFAKIDEAIAALNNLSASFYGSYFTTMDNVVSSASALKTATGSKGSGTGFIGALEAQQSLLTNNATQNITGEALLFMEDVKSYVQQFIDFILDSFSDDLLKCNTFVNIWDSVWLHVCDYAILEIEGIYMPATCIGAMSFTQIIFTLKLSKYFRRMNKPTKVSPSEEVSFNDDEPEKLDNQLDANQNNIYHNQEIEPNQKRSRMRRVQQKNQAQQQEAQQARQPHPNEGIQQNQQPQQQHVQQAQQTQQIQQHQQNYHAENNPQPQNNTQNQSSKVPQQTQQPQSIQKTVQPQPQANPQPNPQPNPPPQPTVQPQQVQPMQQSAARSPPVNQAFTSVPTTNPGAKPFAFKSWEPRPEDF